MTSQTRKILFRSGSIAIICAMLASFFWIVVPAVNALIAAVDAAIND